MVLHDYTIAEQFPLNLQLFADVTNVTTQDSMSVDMKTFYDRNLLENAEPEDIEE